MWRVTDTLVTRTKTVTINGCYHPPTCRPNAEQSNCFPFFSWNAYNNRTCIRVSSRPLSSPNSHNHLWLLSSNKERNSISFTLPFLSLLLFTICNLCLLGKVLTDHPKNCDDFFFFSFNISEYYTIHWIEMELTLVGIKTPYTLTKKSHWWIAAQKEFRN